VAGALLSSYLQPTVQPTELRVRWCHRIRTGRPADASRECVVAPRSVASLSLSRYQPPPSPFLAAIVAVLLVASAVLFVPVESDGLVIGAIVLSVAVSLVLAVVLWREPRRAVFAVVAAFCVVFLVGDVAELVFQLENSHAGLAAIATVVGLGHLAAAGISAAESRGWRP
jgi:hypothetical protein